MEELPPVPERLLDASLEVAAMHGLSRLSVGDVAKRAGLSRQTLYKHFASRDDLISQTVLREAGRIVEQVIAASETEEDPEASLEAAVLEALRALRSHPLLDRLLATEHEALLPLLIDGTGSVQGAMQLVCLQVLESRLPEQDESQFARRRRPAQPDAAQLRRPPTRGRPGARRPLPRGAVMAGITGAPQTPTRPSSHPLLSEEPPWQPSPPRSTARRSPGETGSGTSGRWR